MGVGRLDADDSEHVGIALVCAVLLLAPPASLFFKPNLAFSFAFLQAIGLGVGLSSSRAHDVRRWILYAGCVWVAAILLCFASGAWPVSAGIHPSVENLLHYSRVAIGVSSRSRLLVRWLLDVLTIAVVLIAAARVGADSDRPRAMLRDVAVPLAVVVVALAYLSAGWWLVVPTGQSEGEPMHVNFEMIMWLVTAIVFGTVTKDRDRDADRVPLARPLMPDGNCFWYGRRYAIDVSPPYDPDMVIAATGCPAINATRWRGYLGDNRPDLLRGRSTIDVPAGPPFTLVQVPPR
ncbi:MAG: hypothetical protein HY047_13925 [Acidobacteria bacterium]|nr:hypothetical protein [Acidobacteriota bacterium]